MAYKCLFMDDASYTAQDVNTAISNIIAGGVSNYPLGVNAVSDLNAAVAEIVNGGALYSGTGCLVVKSGQTYKISEGACIMNDGSQIIFDSGGYTISHRNGVYEYVYLERDRVGNKINVVVSSEAGGQDTIPLAEIGTNNNVTDKRRFAGAKVSLSAEPQNIGISKRITHGALSVSNRYFEVDLGFNGWKYIVYKFSNRDDNTGGCIELEDGGTASYFPTDNRSNAGAMTATTVTRTGSVLKFAYIANSGNSGAVDLEFELR